MFTLLNPLLTSHHFFEIANKVGPKKHPKKDKSRVRKILCLKEAFAFMILFNHKINKVHALFKPYMDIYAQYMYTYIQHDRILIMHDITSVYA